MHIVPQIIIFKQQCISNGDNTESFQFETERLATNSVIICPLIILSDVQNSISDITSEPL